jgi:hypothetical protein
MFLRKLMLQKLGARLYMHGSKLNSTNKVGRRTSEIIKKNYGNSYVIRCIQAGGLT